MTVAIAFLLVAVLNACSSDTSIANGFKLLDLGGSNQAIVGPRGVGVTDVTAYSDIGARILFETGDVGKKMEARDPKDPPYCEYGYIDVERNSVVRLDQNGEESAAVRSALRVNPKGVVSRSCLN